MICMNRKYRSMRTTSFFISCDMAQKHIIRARDIIFFYKLNEAKLPTFHLGFFCSSTIFHKISERSKPVLLEK